MAYDKEPKYGLTWWEWLIAIPIGTYLALWFRTFH